MRVRPKAKFNFDGTVEAYEHVEQEKNRLFRKMEARGYTPTAADQIKYQSLVEQEGKIDAKVAKLSSKYEKYAQMSRERLDRIDQTISQGLQHQHAGMFTILAGAGAGTGLLFLRAQHNRLYKDVLPAKSPKAPTRTSDEKYVARQYDRSIAKGLVT